MWRCGKRTVCGLLPPKFRGKQEEGSPERAFCLKIKGASDPEFDYSQKKTLNRQYFAYVGYTVGRSAIREVHVLGRARFA